LICEGEKEEEERRKPMTGAVMLAGVLLVTLFATAAGFYSINYVADPRQHPAKVLNAGGSFLGAPTAEHVADVYARLAGHAPLYRTEAEELPTLDVLAERKEQPIILEVHGGSKLSSPLYLETTSGAGRIGVTDSTGDTRSNHPTPTPNPSLHLYRANRIAERRDRRRARHRI